MTVNEILETRLDGVVMAHSADVKVEVTGTGKDDPSYKLNFKVNFTGWTVKQVLALALRTLVISRQRVWRKMKVAEVQAENGRTFMAADMGKQPQAQVDYKAAFAAEFASASPERQAEMIKELQDAAAKAKE